jgi:iron(III) transport system ATP-binding protein
MARLELRNLTKRFGRQTALDGISLAIEPNTLVALLGPSGCGKTTTLRLVAGFGVPDDGTIVVDGRVLSSTGRSLPPEQRGMSMIFQSYALWPHLTIFENVAYGLRLRKKPGAEIKSRVDAMLKTVRMEALADRYPHELSGGQQQRVALARALIVEPTILLLDEPLSNLDANLREEMRQEIRQLHEKFRFTTIYVTHDQSEAMTTADLIVVMNQGRIEQAGSPEQIYERPESAFVAKFIGGTNILTGRPQGDAIDCDGLVLGYGQGRPGGDGKASVSIRPHHIELRPGGGTAAAANEAIGRVESQTYLGPHRDYVVTLRTGQRLRVTTPSGVSIAPGSDVVLQLPRQWCRALSR